MKKRKPKLMPRFRHSHLINCGFRVDLHEDKEEFGHMDESVCFEIIEATKEKLKVRMYHMLYYPDGRGEHTDKSYDIYEIDLTASYNEKNVKYLGNEFSKKKKRK